MLKKVSLGLIAAAGASAVLASSYFIVTPFEPATGLNFWSLKATPQASRSVVSGVTTVDIPLSTLAQLVGGRGAAPFLAWNAESLPPGLTLEDGQLRGVLLNTGPQSAVLTATGADQSRRIEIPFTASAELVEKNGVRLWSDNQTSTSCNDYIRPSEDVRNYAGATGSGIYKVSLPSGIKDVYCEMSIADGGWILVRRASGTNWGPWNDNATGTTAYGTYIPNPLNASTFSLQYNNIPHTELLFSTGSQVHWVSTNSPIPQKAEGSLYLANKSSISTEPYNVFWHNRSSRAEDPWISVRAHDYNGTSAYMDNESNSMVYGENAEQLWTYYLINHQGANVFIR